MEEENLLLITQDQRNTHNPKQLFDYNTIKELQQTAHSIYVDDKINNYVLDIVHATRFPSKYKLDIKDYIECGASPRASLDFIRAAKAYALIQKRNYVIPEDIRYIAPDILRHRILLSYEAHSQEITTEEIIDNILNSLKIP